MGSVEGIFVADEAEIGYHKGKKAFLGEVLGKFSDVVDDDWESNLTVLTDDQEFIAKFLEFKAESGFNPLNYVADQ